MKKRKIVITEQDLVKFLKNYAKDLYDPFEKNIKNLQNFGVPDITKDFKNYLNLGFQPNFRKVVDKVIEKIEGGYYHPDMKSKDPKRFHRMGRSGETMYGIDRRHGSDLKMDKFWSLIDADRKKNPSKWKYLYDAHDNPQLSEQLKSVVAEVLEPVFKQLQNEYLTPEARKIVNSDPIIYFHFGYATWNGDGWFKDFAKKFNEQVKKGKKIPELRKFVIEDRKGSSNSIVAKNGRKIESFANELT